MILDTPEVDRTNSEPASIEVTVDQTASPAVNSQSE